MNGFVCSRAGTVLRQFTYPGCKFRDARCTPWRPRSNADFSNRSLDQSPNRPPPLLQPAPGANSFSVTTSAPDISPLRHLATRLVRSSASKAGLITPDREEAAAGYSDQLHAHLRCHASYELHSSMQSGLQRQWCGSHLQSPHPVLYRRCPTLEHQTCNHQSQNAKYEGKFSHNSVKHQHSILHRI